MARWTRRGGPRRDPLLWRGRDRDKSQRECRREEPEETARTGADGNPSSLLWAALSGFESLPSSRSASVVAAITHTPAMTVVQPRAPVPCDSPAGGITVCRQLRPLLNRAVMKREQSGIGAQQIDRRRFLEYAAGAGAMVSLGGSVFARGQNAVPADQAPPGAGRTRACPTAPSSPLGTAADILEDLLRRHNAAPADDNGPGHKARPFRTINKAAQVLQPGERVVIASGTYRECVRPARGGTGPAQMISYEAAPGAKVIIKGSEVLKDGWRAGVRSVGVRLPECRPQPGAAGHRLASRAHGAMFPDAYNPFALPSIMGSWAWLDTRMVDMGPYLRRRGLVFVDGKPLEPMEQLRELAMPKLPPVPDFTVPAAPQNGLPPRRRGGPIMQEVGGSPDARFWVEDSGTAIHVRLASGTPADHLIEVTTRKQAFVPAQSGTGLHPRQGDHLPACRQRLSVSAVRHGLAGRRRSLDPRRQHHRMGQRRAASTSAATATAARARRPGHRRSSAATPSATAASKASAAWEPPTP